MYNLRDLLTDIDYICDKEISYDAEVRAITSDSKKTTPGCLFVCLKGLRKDSHEFINEVIKRGALAIICEKECRYKSENAVIIHVENPHSVYAKILSRAYGNPEKRMKLIAVTGTNGKTTITNMISSALTYLGRKTALIGTLGGFFGEERYSIGTMTTPDPELLYPLLRRYADMGAEYAVMELSSHALALYKADGLKFVVGAITNLSPEHLDFHGNMKKYCEAKSRLFTFCQTGVFCVDDEYTSKMAQECTCERVIKCSLSAGNANIYASDVTLCGVRGTSLTVRHPGGGTHVFSPIPGSFTASNVLVAFSVLTALGFTPEEAGRGIESLKGVRGRMEVLPTDTDFTVMIDFAHTPDALSKLLQSVRRMRNEGQRIVTLFGCGGDRDPSKRSLMGAIASRLSDFVILTSDNSRSENPSAIIDQIMTGFDNNCPHVRIDNRRDAIIYAVENAGIGDIVLLCGKGHEEYEIDSIGMHPFSERETVYGAIDMLKKRTWSKTK